MFKTDVVSGFVSKITLTLFHSFIPPIRLHGVVLSYSTGTTLLYFIVKFQNIDR
jgi:hypothetical protein